MKEDVKIAQEAKILPIKDVAKSIGLQENDLELYGKYKAKISMEIINKIDSTKKGKLILVTAINPTSAGEGKTTTMIGLAQAMNKIGKKTIVAMREPSLGPCFGLKGGAAGGGYAQVIPMEDINLHFTGDIHAITSAHNLISAMLDNSIHQDNPLNIDVRRVVWKRVVDLNDRSLRKVNIGLGGIVNGVPREDGFDITVASEIMAVLCLANNLVDLKQRISKIIIAYNNKKEPITVNDIKATGAVMVLLKDAIKPNLVQTLDNTPALVHGGPFANIAHGCNSVVATKLALSLADYTLTEAGFGADLGAEKFFDIKCRQANLKPDAVVLVATIRALKLHGGLNKKDLLNENIKALENGIENLEKHIENIKKYQLPLIVAINVFPTDTKAELDLLYKICKKYNVEVSISEVFSKGAIGGINLAEKLCDIIESTENNFKFIYDLNQSIETKISIIVKEIYGGNQVTYSKKALNSIKQIEKLGLSNLPICMAKNQYSLSDDPKLLGRPKDFNISISDLIPNKGAGFIVALTGDVMRMPGLPKEPAAINMDVLDDGTIIGLF